MRRLRTLPTLAQHGIVQQGTVIEVIPEALPANLAAHDPRVFRAKIANVAGLRGSVTWEQDGAQYSLTEVTQILWEQFGVTCFENYIFKHWRIVGHAESMWAEAERFPK